MKMYLAIHFIILAYILQTGIASEKSYYKNNVGFEDLFTSETSEHSDIACAISGDLPSWISGTLVSHTSIEHIL